MSKLSFEEAWNYFGPIYVINLKKRKDRLNQFTDEMKKIGKRVTRIEAVEVGDNPAAKNGGWYYCDRSEVFGKAHLVNASHRKAAKFALEQGLDRLIIAEDDAFFPEGTDWHNSFCEAVNELKDQNWELFYFGTSQMASPIIVNEHLSRCVYPLMNHFYAINGKETLEWIATQMEPALDNHIASVLVRKGNAYAPLPMIAYQRNNFSDNVNVYRDNQDLMALINRLSLEKLNHARKERRLPEIEWKKFSFL